MSEYYSYIGLTSLEANVEMDTQKIRRASRPSQNDAQVLGRLSLDIRDGDYTITGRLSDHFDDVCLPGSTCSHNDDGCQRLYGTDELLTEPTPGQYKLDSPQKGLFVATDIERAVTLTGEEDNTLYGNFYVKNPLKSNVITPDPEDFVDKSLPWRLRGEGVALPNAMLYVTDPATNNDRQTTSGKLIWRPHRSNLYVQHRLHRQPFLDESMEPPSRIHTTEMR